jgi:tetratricopeptide (TPR) repeat protein
MGRHTDAVELFNKVLSKQPTYYWAQFRRGLSYEQIGEKTKAIEDLKVAKERIEPKDWNDELKEKISEYGL